MTINYASKYAKTVDERFSLESLTDKILNLDYEWTGVDTVKIYSVETVEMGNYTRSGLQRYGTPSELQDSIQSLTVSQDKCFTFTIDKVIETSQMENKAAGVALSRQLNEVVVPAVDTYRISKLIDGANTVTTSQTTKSNAYEQFLNAMETLSDNKVPISGRVALVAPSFYKFLKLDDTFIKNSDLGQEVAFNGQVGVVDGVPVIVAPSSYFTGSVNFVVTHTSALVSPIKLADYKIHVNPPGISGSLIEGRIVYDAFVLTNKKCAVYAHQTSAPVLSEENK